MVLHSIKQLELEDDMIVWLGGKLRLTRRGS